MTATVLSGSCCPAPADGSRDAEEPVVLLAQQVIKTQPSPAKREFPGAPAHTDNRLQCSTFGREKSHRHSPSSEIARWFAAVGQTCRYRSLVQRAKPRTHLRRPSSACLRRFPPSVRTRSALAGMVASSKEPEPKIRPVTNGQPLLATTCESRMSPELRWCASRGRSSGVRRNCKIRGIASVKGALIEGAGYELWFRLENRGTDLIFSFEGMCQT